MIRSRTFDSPERLADFLSEEYISKEFIVAIVAATHKDDITEFTVFYER